MTMSFRAASFTLAFALATGACALSHQARNDAMVPDTSLVDGVDRVVTDSHDAIDIAPLEENAADRVDAFDASDDTVDVMPPMDVVVDTGVDVQPDIQPVDTGVDVQPVDTGVDVPVATDSGSTTCGGGGQACCGTTCGAGQSCVDWGGGSTSCAACGGNGQACCGTMCNSGLTCRSFYNNVVHACSDGSGPDCGGPGQPCCFSFMPCSAGACVGTPGGAHICRTDCGSSGQPCCPGGTCRDLLSACGGGNICQ